MKYLLLAAILLSGCESQTRSTYQMEGTIDDKFVSITIKGVANTADSAPDLATFAKAATAALKGDIATLAEQVAKAVSKPVAEEPFITGKDGAGLAAIASTLAFAYAKHREMSKEREEKEKQRADADDGWQKAGEAQREALSLAKALPPDRVPA